LARHQRQKKGLRVISRVINSTIPQSALTFLRQPHTIILDNNAPAFQGTQNAKTTQSRQPVCSCARF
jgi:hypothetical protein